TAPREPAGVHTGRVAGSCGGAAVLRGADTATPPAVYRVDRVRQARGNETAAPEGGDSPFGPRQTTGIEMMPAKRRKVIVHIATSADGYIARPDGDLEWLTSRPAPKGFY